MSDDCVYLLVFQRASGKSSILAFNNAEACLECQQYLNENYDVFINLCSKIKVNHRINEEIKRNIKDRIEE